jgi:transcriptional regulator with XRE-family HTH domain
MNFSPEQFRAARALLNWSQADLAERARVARVTVAAAEAPAGRVAPASLRALAAALEAAGVRFVRLGRSVRVSALVAGRMSRGIWVGVMLDQRPQPASPTSQLLAATKPRRCRNLPDTRPLPPCAIDLDDVAAPPGSEIALILHHLAGELAQIMEMLDVEQS